MKDVFYDGPEGQWSYSGTDGESWWGMWYSADEPIAGTFMVDFDPRLTFKPPQSLPDGVSFIGSHASSIHYVGTDGTRYEYCLNGTFRATIEKTASGVGLSFNSAKNSIGLSDTEKRLLADYPEFRKVGRLPGTEYLVFEHNGDLFSIQGSVVCRMDGKWVPVEKPFFTNENPVELPKEHWHNNAGSPISIGFGPMTRHTMNLSTGLCTTIKGIDPSVVEAAVKRGEFSQCSRCGGIDANPGAQVCQRCDGWGVVPKSIDGDVT